ncbi:hypothetical protein CANMA_003432 [Candida margitis]|uniref:uncharacterized protein n=1 Tax=Candida margitis TaxID=1775924 RepID=UPI0022276CE3|nr:uncharacterized protein CANMA_003432 [Candida margitis]KAI5964922.1 hypothetical protein CANMA_003432 [Candida margitis]
MTITMTASPAPILKAQPQTEEIYSQSKPSSDAQPRQHQDSEEKELPIEAPRPPPPVTVKTSKEWVLPPRPKPGRKLKDTKESKMKKKCNKKSTVATSTSAPTATTTTRKASTTSHSSNSRASKKNDCCSNELNPDLSSVSSLLQNISIIDSENSYLKSNLLCLIHEYKHLKDMVLNTPLASSESLERQTSNSTSPVTTTAAIGTTTTAFESAAESSPEALADMVDSITHSVRAVHKRSFVELCEDEEDLLLEVERIGEEGEPLRRMSTPAPRSSAVSSGTTTTATATTSSTSASSPIATAMGYNSSTIDTVASTPLPASLEFEQFINIDESEDTNAKEVNINEASASSVSPTYKSKKFAHYKDFHKLDTEEDSDGDINFEEDDLINVEAGEEEDAFLLGELCTPSSTSSTDLSRTTSPYSDYETNSLMSTLTRTTTGSSINTVIHEKPNFASVNVSEKSGNNNFGYTSIHPPPLTLKKMGNFFDLPKYQENDKLYSFKFDTAEYQAKRIDDEYNLVTDLLEEKLMSNEINYYSQQQQQQMGLGHVQGQMGLGHDDDHDDDVNDRGSFMNFY